MDISIIIPTKNGAKTIENCLLAIKNQKTKRTFEIIAIDSGSTDDTVPILEKFGCNIIKIPPSEFSHGQTRNLGAEGAEGSILIFINQDAIPDDELWMEKLVQEIDDQVVAAFSRQIPYQDTPIAEQVFLSRIYHKEPNIIDVKSLQDRKLNESVLLSTVSCAVVKDTFMQFKFSPDIIMSEDQELAVRLIRAGYRIKYVPSSVIIHSHSYSISQVFRRYFDVGWSVYSIPALGKFSAKRALSEQMGILLESLRMARKNGRGEYMFTIAYTVAKLTGFMMGTKAGILPEKLRLSLSYTVRLKRVAN